MIPQRKGPSEDLEVLKSLRRARTIFDIQVNYEMLHLAPAQNEGRWGSSGTGTMVDGVQIVVTSYLT